MSCFRIWPVLIRTTRWTSRKADFCFSIDVLTHAFEAYARMASDFTGWVWLLKLQECVDYLPSAYENGRKIQKPATAWSHGILYGRYGVANAFLGLNHFACA